MSVSAASTARGPLAAPLAVLAVFAVMTSSMMVMPAVRPVFAARGASESTMHAFMSVAMLGAAILSPLFAVHADRTGKRRRLLVALALADAALIGACATPLPSSAVLAIRLLQGGCNVAALSLAMTIGVRRHDGDADGKGPAMAGAAMMSGLVVGPPLGGALLGIADVAPFVGAAALMVLVALVTLFSMDSTPEKPRVEPARISLFVLVRRAPALVVPAGIAFVERFTVGCFVVTFALRAHGVLGMSDTRISLGYSLFLVPFALAIHPVTMLSRRVPRATLLTAGGVLYGITFLAFGVADGPWLSIALVVAGLASAMMYAPALCYASTLAPREARTTAMASFHAAGCLGMMFGPAVAGILSAVLRRSGTDDVARYAAIFAFAGIAQLLAILALRSRLATLRAAEQDGFTQNRLDPERNCSR